MGNPPNIEKPFVTRHHHIFVVYHQDSIERHLLYGANQGVLKLAISGLRLGGCFGLFQSYLGPFALRELLRDANNPYQSAGLIVHRKCPLPDPFFLSFRGQDSVLRCDVHSLQLLLEYLVGLVAVFAMDGIQPVHRVLIEAGAAPSPDLFVGRTDV